MDGVRTPGPLRTCLRSFMTRVLMLTVLLGIAAGSAFAGPREQAKRMHDRLAGVPPSDATLDAMAADITGGNALTAALTATDAPTFYDVTLKNFVTPWTNRDQTVFAPLNDYTATVIGMVRDDVPFNTVLSANILYVGAPGLGLPAYSMTSNAHYQALDDQGIDLKANLVQTTQTAVTDLPAGAVAGVITTRAASEAFFVAGTNRAMFRFTVLNHLCKNLEEIKDTTLPVDRIRQDVSRSPGGDSRIFMNNCVGCHSGMDPMAQAFAYYNFDATAGRLLYTANQVQPKYLINQANFKPGYRHAGRPLGQLLAPRPEPPARLVRPRCPAPAAARSRSASSSATATPSRTARSRRCFATSACAIPWTGMTARRSIRWSRPSAATATS